MYTSRNVHIACMAEVTGNEMYCRNCSHEGNCTLLDDDSVDDLYNEDIANKRKAMMNE